MASKGGLEGVVLTQSNISYIDGQIGKLIYQGYNIHDLAEQSTFEEVVYLLWNGRLPSQDELDSFSAELASERSIPDELYSLIESLTGDNPMAALRTAVSALSQYDEQADDDTPEANRAKARKLVAKLPTIVTAFHRYREGLEPVKPDPDLGHAANFVYMLNGEKPSEDVARVFDVALILHADHGLNASTFTARVISSTLSDLYSAITGAIGALKGPLHGGANTNVMKTLKEIGSLDNVEDYVRKALANKERIMGFGHRVYKTMDPRAIHLKEMSKTLGEEKGDTKWYEMSVKMQEIMKEEKGLDPNVDFYSASTYYTLGVPIDLFTPIFAMSRVSGWSAHVLEQYENNRLIRPRAEYVGPMDLDYVPVSER